MRLTRACGLLSLALSALGGSATITAEAPPTAAAPRSQAGAAANSVIQRQDTNEAGISAELTECSRKDGVLTVKVRLHNTGTAAAAMTVLAEKSDFAKFYVTAANKKYFILTDSEKTYLAPQLDAGYPWIKVKIAPGSSYQWYAKFPAPPASEKTLTLYTPWTAPFDDVPITDK
jgi:hypothetical protein